MKEQIFCAAEHCMDATNDPEDGLQYGTAGYLYVLNVLKSEHQSTMAQSSEPLKQLFSGNDA